MDLERISELENLNEGEKVRIYLEYVGNSDVYIREGKVIKSLDHKLDSFLSRHALKMLVEKRGMIIRGKPCVEKTKPYTRSYFYYCIKELDFLD